MNREDKYITSPEEMLGWMKEHEEFKEMNRDDVKLLLRYLDENNYKLTTDKEGDYFKAYVGTGKTHEIRLTLDELIDIVCELNYEQIEEKIEQLKIADKSESTEIEAKLAKLKQEEKQLDKMFEQTCYAADLNKLAHKLAEAILERMGEVGIDRAVGELKANIRASSSGGVR